ncbi:MAG: malic enzyme-like NAD(P)-binding protein [Blastocatellia bacterium]|nr:malic enzyme-like NAD(P)-binding protein [Blastocatellia bacterium]
MSATPSEGYSITLRLKLANRPGMLGHVTSAIGEAGGNIGAVDIVEVGAHHLMRDITVACGDDRHAEAIVEAVAGTPDVTVINVSDRTFLRHLGGKIEIRNKRPLQNRSDLSMAYTPGVARVCTAIYKDPEKVYNLTIKRNCIAVVTDGTAVLGLGDIGPYAAMPVMEGKAMLFKEFAGIDAFPICLDTKDVDEIVRTVKAIAPAFGGINLEDIGAPRCFEVEARLKRELDIPVFHDDQHGTAVVVLAAALNALKIVEKKLEEIKIVVVGIGAAGTACTKMLLRAGARNIIGCDLAGAIYRGRTEEMDSAKAWYAENTNPENLRGSLDEVIEGADLFLGVSGPGALKVESLKKMGRDPIVFALANPTPEIMPEEAWPHVKVMATGRSDYPNQINNVLCFPGIFRGALDCRATDINEDMKLAAAHAIASVIPADELHPEHIIPSVFNRQVAPLVAKAVEEAARRSGVARRDRSKEKMMIEG